VDRVKIFPVLFVFLSPQQKRSCHNFDGAVSLFSTPALTRFVVPNSLSFFFNDVPQQSCFLHMDKQHNSLLFDVMLHHYWSSEAAQDDWQMAPRASN
jgi:hypothetical protein